MITIKDFSAAAFEKKCDLIVSDSDYIMVRNREDANFTATKCMVFCEGHLFHAHEKGEDD